MSGTKDKNAAKHNDTASLFPEDIRNDHIEDRAAEAQDLDNDNGADMPYPPSPNLSHHKSHHKTQSQMTTPQMQLGNQLGYSPSNSSETDGQPEMGDLDARKQSERDNQQQGETQTHNSGQGQNQGQGQNSGKESQNPNAKSDNKPKKWYNTTAGRVGLVALAIVTLPYSIYAVAACVVVAAAGAIVYGAAVGVYKGIKAMASWFSNKKKGSYDVNQQNLEQHETVRGASREDHLHPEPAIEQSVDRGIANVARGNNGVSEAIQSLSAQNPSSSAPAPVRRIHSTAINEPRGGRGG